MARCHELCFALTVVLLSAILDFVSVDSIKVLDSRASRAVLPTSKDIPPPDFVGPIENVTVAVGREAVLSCVVSNLGTYRVGWMRADDQTILSLHNRIVTHSTRYSITQESDTTWKLHIRPVKEYDRGCYMCQINTPSMKKQLACIDVYVPPNILDEGSSADQTAREGEDVTLTCKAEGKPKPRITWRREGGTSLMMRNGTGELYKVDSMPGENIKLSKVDRKQMGAYLCIASNDVPPSVSKRIMVNIHFPPTVLVANKVIGVPSRSSVTIECFVEAYPATVNYWIKNRGETVLKGTNYEIAEERISAYQFRMTLRIVEFRSSDIASYTCIASNQIGRNDGVIRLYEIHTTTSTTTTPRPSTTTPTTTTSTKRMTTTRTTTTRKKITTETYPYYQAIPLPPAEQKLLNQDVTTFDSMENILEQSVLDNSYTSTSATSRGAYIRLTYTKQAASIAVLLSLMVLLR